MLRAVTLLILMAGCTPTNINAPTVRLPSCIIACEGGVAVGQGASITDAPKP